MKAFEEILEIVDRCLPKDEHGAYLAFHDGPGWKYDPETKTGTGKCPEMSDVVHDFLAFLAEQMLELNKQKQAELKRFLGWLEEQLSILSDSKGGRGIEALSGKTRIQNYLGDYQKGEEPAAFPEILKVLLKNRSRIKANLSDSAFVRKLEKEYEKSLAILLSIKERLAKTDWLIDQIVYRLYGVTEAEIAIVERQG